MVITDHIFLCA